MKENLAVVILAAGMGTRMRSKIQKILHQVGGLPMIEHVVRAAEAVSAQPPLLVIGPLGGERVRALFGDRARYVVQAEQLGTGHATQVAAPLLQESVQQVLVTYGDMPLLKAETLAALAQRQAERGVALAMLSLLGDPASSFGRVVRNSAGQVIEIVEVAEARQRPNRDELLATREQNAGVYCFDAAWLWEELPQLPPRQARSGTEYYLTDLVEVAVKQGRGVEALITDDPDEALGAGTRAELIPVDRAFRRRVNGRWLAAGVTIIDPATTYIDPDVTIGQDTVIWPNSYLQGTTTIGTDCIIGPNVILRNTQIGDGAHVEQQKRENG